MDNRKPANLQDILNYSADSYFSPEEMAWIKTTFKEPSTIKILRKLFLPSVGDPELPPEEMANDIWLQGRDYSGIPNEEIKSIVLARQEAIKFILGTLVRIKVLAHEKEETSVEKAYRLKRDSNK